MTENKDEKERTGRNRLERVLSLAWIRELLLAMLIF